MPKKPDPTFSEKGERLLMPEDDYENLEDMRAYYPNLNPSITPRDWDEPPWRSDGSRESGRSKGADLP